MERYKKNWGTFLTKENQYELLKKHILVIGCGGNAEYILEYLARLGVRKITFFDGDIWEESNLNRQTFCTENSIGISKVQGSLQQLQKINSSIEYVGYNEYFSKTAALNILSSNDLPDFIIYAADANVNVLECRDATLLLVKHNIPILDECICYNGVVISGITQECLKLWYECSDEWIASGKNPVTISQPAYFCSLAACLTVSEMIRFFFDFDNAIINKRLIYDIWEGRTYLLDVEQQTYLY